MNTSSTYRSTYHSPSLYDLIDGEINRYLVDQLNKNYTTPTKFIGHTSSTNSRHYGRIISATVKREEIRDKRKYKRWFYYTDLSTYLHLRPSTNRKKRCRYHVVLPLGKSFNPDRIRAPPAMF